MRTAKWCRHSEKQTHWHNHQQKLKHALMMIFFAMVYESGINFICWMPNILITTILYLANGVRHFVCIIMHFCFSTFLLMGILMNFQFFFAWRNFYYFFPKSVFIFLAYIVLVFHCCYSFKTVQDRSYLILFNSASLWAPSHHLTSGDVTKNP